MKCEAVYCPDTATVRFAIYPEGPDDCRIIVHISEGALRSVFGASGAGENLVAVCRDHFDGIERRALERYRANPTGAVLLTMEDFAKSPAAERASAAASMA